MPGADLATANRTRGATAASAAATATPASLPQSAATTAASAAATATPASLPQSAATTAVDKVTEQAVEAATQHRAASATLPRAAPPTANVSSTRGRAPAAPSGALLNQTSTPTASAPALGNADASGSGGGGGGDGGGSLSIAMAAVAACLVMVVVVAVVLVRRRSRRRGRAVLSTAPVGEIGNAEQTTEFFTNPMFAGQRRAAERVSATEANAQYAVPDEQGGLLTCSTAAGAGPYNATAPNAVYKPGDGAAGVGTINHTYESVLYSIPTGPGLPYEVPLGDGERPDYVDAEGSGEDLARASPCCSTAVDVAEAREPPLGATHTAVHTNAV